MIQSWRSRASGFTLLEVLVGLAIFGMMTMLLMSSLSTLATGARTGQARLDRLDEERLIRMFLRRQIEQAYPVTRTGQAGVTVIFDGRPDELRFVGHLPAHRGGGGLQLLKLSVDRTGDSPALVLATRTAWRNEAHASSEGWQVYPLVTKVRSIKFNYFGSRRAEDRARWGEAWTDTERLPELVRLELDVTGSPAWPPLVIAVRAQTAEAQPHLLLEFDREGA